MTELSVQNREYPATSRVPELQDTFNQAYETFYSDVVSYLRRHGADNDAEDIAQEAFVNALTHLDSYQDRGKLGAWLYTLAKNALMDYHRRKRVRPLDFTDDAEMLDRAAYDYGTDPGTTVVLDHARDDLLAAVVSKVTPDQALIFKLREQSYTNTEISEMLDVPRGTIGSRISRGHEALIAAGIHPLD